MCHEQLSAQLCKRKANVHINCSFTTHGLQDAMYFLRRYIEITATAGAASAGGAAGGATDRATEGVAHTTYAQCLQRVGDVAGAISSLEAYLEALARWVRGKGEGAC